MPSPTGLPLLAPSRPSGEGRLHHLAADPANYFWGHLDRSLPPVLTVDPGDRVVVEAITHHSGDAPDLLMDEFVTALWAAIPEADRGPGVHIMNGPIAVRGAQVGDTVAVRVLSMTPRLPYGSNCAAHWGLLYDTFQKERITIYELDTAVAGPGSVGDDGGLAFGEIARPLFGYDFTARPLYDVPGIVTSPAAADRQTSTMAVRIPVRPHFGVIGVAPATTERLSSVPPGPFGGNIDNWRTGPGATLYLPVSADGALVYVGDPHFAQGDGEICGTAIEASLNAVIELDLAPGLAVSAPVLETAEVWQTHGFGDDLDEAMRMAADQMLWLLLTMFGLDGDDAYSLCSVAVDFAVTQVVDGKVGCHASLKKVILGA